MCLLSAQWLKPFYEEVLLMNVVPDYRLIGVRIRKQRLSMKLTQEIVAEKAGIGIQHMSKIENGNTKLSLPCLIAIANALQTTVDSLLIDNINVSKSCVISEADSLFADCTSSEIYVMTQTINTLKQSMRVKGLSDKAHG
jgi:transcriptional regulator with XRE-family HTH domain